MITGRLASRIFAASVLALAAAAFLGLEGKSLSESSAPSSGANQQKQQDKPSKSLSESNEREKGLVAAVLKRQKELDAREEELKAFEYRLNMLKKDIEAKTEELKKVEGDIEAYIKKIDEISNGRIKKIVKIYESMSPEDAASRIDKLNDDMAVTILSSMNEKKAAQIMGLVDVGKSVRLSQSFKLKKMKQTDQANP